MHFAVLRSSQVQNKNGIASKKSQTRPNILVLPLFWFNHDSYVPRTVTHQLLQPRNLVPFNSLSWELHGTWKWLKFVKASTDMSWRDTTIFPCPANIMISQRAATPPACTKSGNSHKFSTYFCFGSRYVPKNGTKNNSDMWSNIQNIQQRQRAWRFLLVTSAIAKRHLGTQCDHQPRWPDLGFRCSTLRCDLHSSLPPICQLREVELYHSTKATTSTPVLISTFVSIVGVNRWGARQFSLLTGYIAVNI